MTVAAVAAAVLVGATLQSATGFGFSLVTAPFLFAVYAPGAALTLLAVLAPVLSLLVLLTERRRVDIDWGQAVPVTLWAVPGMALGVVILRAVDKPVLQVAVGVAVAIAVALELRAGAAAAAGRWPVPPVGVATGTLSTTVGISGPPVLLHLLRTEADQHRVRDTMAATFLLLTAPVLGALAVGGRLSLEDIDPSALAGLLVVVAVGRPLGRWLFLRLDAGRFRRVGLGLALMAGAGSVVAGLAG